MSDFEGGEGVEGAGGGSIESNRGRLGYFCGCERETS